MPSPFPGMDPYLERPARWPDVHHRLITIASDLLSVQLRPTYFLRIEERVYISDEEDEGRRIIPDLRVVSPEGKSNLSVANVAGQQAESDQPLVLTTLLDDEIHEAFLKVIHKESGETITIIEILSPANKVRGAKGRESYEEKRNAVLNSPTHFVEIDLLRAGHRHSTMPKADYIVHISPKWLRPRGQVWPIRLRDRLPAIPIPLKSKGESVPLNLQEVLNTAYERASYDLDTDYSKDADPPLEKDHVEWAREQVGKGALPKG